MRFVFVLLGVLFFSGFVFSQPAGNPFGEQDVGYSVPVGADIFNLGELRGNIEVYTLLDVNSTDLFIHSIEVQDAGRRVSVLHSVRPIIINVTWTPNIFRYAVTTDLIESGQFVSFSVRHADGSVEYLKWLKGQTQALVFDSNNVFDQNHLVFNGFIRDFRQERLNGFVPSEIRVEGNVVRLFFTTSQATAGGDIVIGDTIIETTFVSGTHQQTETGADGNVSLATISGSTIFSDGNYTSKVYDANVVSDWLDFNWSEGQPYKFALPDFNRVAPDINMQKTGYLYHLNGDAVDTTTGNSGTLLGNTTCNSGGVFGSACYFDGTNDKVLLPNAVNVDINVFTVSLWVARSKQTAAASRQAVIHGAETGSADEVMRIEIDDTNNPRWDDDFSGLVLVPIGCGLTDVNKFYHIAVIKTQTDINLFINGVNCGSDAAITANTGKLGAQNFIGDRTDTNVSELQGFVDDVAIWSRALSVNEIQNIYRRGQLDINVRVRSCDDANCVGESFVGGDGSANSFFLDGNTSYDLNVVADNRFFQFIAFFASKDANVLFDPYLLDVAVDFQAVAGGDSCTDNGVNFDWVINDLCHFKNAVLNIGSGSLFVASSGLIGLDASTILARGINLILDASETRQQFAQGGQVILKHG